MGGRKRALRCRAHPRELITLCCFYSHYCGVKATDTLHTSKIELGGTVGSIGLREAMGTDKNRLMLENTPLGCLVKCYI